MAKPVGVVQIVTVAYMSLLNPDSNRYERKEVPAYMMSDAVAVTPGDHDGHFVVTHLASGGRMTPQVDKIGVASAMFDVYVALGDILLEEQPYTNHREAIRAANRAANAIYQEWHQRKWGVAG